MVVEAGVGVLLEVLQNGEDAHGDFEDFHVDLARFERDVAEGGVHGFRVEGEAAVAFGARHEGLEFAQEEVGVHVCEVAEALEADEVGFYFGADTRSVELLQKPPVLHEHGRHLGLLSVVRATFQLQQRRVHAHLGQLQNLNLLQNHCLKSPLRLEDLVEQHDRVV